MSITFKKAVKKQAKLRLAIQGAAGSGKTYSSLILATALGKKIAVIDTEHGSASLYSDKFNFDVLEIKAPYTPEKYVDAMRAAEAEGYEVIVLDSISHEWNGEGGCLDIVSNIGGNSFTAWKQVTPRHDKFIGAILASNAHIVATMRSKTEYIMSQGEGSKSKVEKKGMAPIQRDQVDYEFTTVFDLNQNHYANTTKDRTGIFVGKDFPITAETGKALLDWLNSGVSLETVKVEEENSTRAQFSVLYSTREFDAAKFLEYFKVTNVKDLNFVQIKAAISMLESKPLKAEQEQAS